MIGQTLIEIPAWGTLTLIEAIWLVSGLTAMIFAGSHIRPLYDDWALARDSGRPVLTAVAGGYLRREIVRLAQGVCLASIGVYAALEPPAIPGPAFVTPVGLVLTGVLLTVSLLVSVQSGWDWRTRHEVQRLIAEGKNGNH